MHIVLAGSNYIIYSSYLLFNLNSTNYNIIYDQLHLNDNRGILPTSEVCSVRGHPRIVQVPNPNVVSSVIPHTAV